jgi:hypothetical protein
MNAKHPPQSREGDGGGMLDLWARTRAAGDHPDLRDQLSEPVAVTVVQPCTCDGGPRPRSRLAATCRTLLGWTPAYRFDPACPAHQQLGDLPAYRRTRAPIVFAERLPRLVASRYTPRLRRGHRRPLAWWGHRHHPSGQTQVALAWCRPEWFTRYWCGALQVERGWHQPYPWPARSPAWRARPSAAAPAAQEASDA